MQLGLDRFTFKNGRQCFIELGSEQEAQKAIAELNNAALLGQVLIVKALKHDFVWGSHKETSEELITSRFFDETTTSALEAVKPLLESRRMMLSVQTPGWGNEHSTVGHNRIALGKKINKAPVFAEDAFAKLTS
jgi:RNA recognition motif-containing protein